MIYFELYFILGLLWLLNCYRVQWYKFKKEGFDFDDIVVSIIVVLVWPIVIMCAIKEYRKIK